MAGCTRCGAADDRREPGTELLPGLPHADIAWPGRSSRCLINAASARSASSAA
jgi:hypothetical protein